MDPTPNDARKHAPATGRNREPILEALRRFISPRASVLEIASGSGEHAVFLASRLEVASWQPTDVDPAARESVDAWCAHERGIHPASGLAVLPALELDVTSASWRDGGAGLRADVIFSANMIHIAAFVACEGLFEGAAHVLPAPQGQLFLYGPFRRHGAHTAESNEAFDLSLKSRNAEWGVRDLEGEVLRVASRHGFSLSEIVPMPANNLIVRFTREGRSPHRATAPTSA